MEAYAAFCGNCRNTTAATPRIPLAGVRNLVCSTQQNRINILWSVAQKSQDIDRNLATCHNDHEAGWERTSSLFDYIIVRITIASMPQLRMYNLFISHSWAYGDEYARLIKLLNAAPNFWYCNYSVPKDDPIQGANTNSQLRAAIKRQMDCASVVLILAGVYATYSRWINEEIVLAKSYTPAKKIIAIEQWGAERTSTIVKANADAIVRWSTSSIVDAIRRLA